MTAATLTAGASAAELLERARCYDTEVNDLLDLADWADEDQRPEDAQDLRDRAEWCETEANTLRDQAATINSYYPYAPVGAVVRCGYWQENYTVLSHNENGTVTIRWHGKHDSLGLNRFPAGRIGTHRTPFDAHTDRIVQHPQAANA